MKSLLLILFLGITYAWAQLTPAYNNVWIPTRDGEALQADVYIPDGVDSSEVILIQTPYNKEFFAWSLPMGVGMDLDEQPFIWVIVDWRGFYGSSGADLSDFSRGEDGYDICEWISEQDWHKSKIGTWGPSALGGVQYQTARENHPNHTCAVPLVATGHQSYDSYFYGGVLEEARLNQLDALGYGLSPLVLSNPYDNLLWQLADLDTWFPSDIQIPTLQIGGWYDHNIDKMMDFYTDSRNMAALDVQDEQWLLVGPWVHGGTGAAYVGSEEQGELSYPDATFRSDTMAWQFLEYYLLGLDNGWDDTPAITYYELGDNGWHTTDADDIHSTESGVLFLDSEGKLNGVGGVGMSSFTSDPENPSPTIGGATLSSELEQGPYDQNELDTRSDILTFSTDVLTEPISVTGRIRVKLYISSDQPDCDIAIRLTDLYPDGRSMLITDGIKRMRFRNNEFGEDDEEFIVPGEIYEVEVDLPFTNYTWLPGHALKVYVSGNHAVRFNVNLQDGGEMYIDGDGNVAEITVHHNAENPGQIILPGDNPTLSVNEEQAFLIRLYPNPVTDVLYVEGGDFKTYTIKSISGKEVQSGTFNEMISVSDLNTGIYIIELSTPNGQKLIRKMIKR